MDKNQTAIDEKFMRRCIQLAECGRNLARPNPMVGCVIVADDKIIGEGYHIRCGEGHAEVNAFAAVKSEDEHRLAQATLYVSLEPCSHHGKTPPCADLIAQKGVRRVVMGSIDPFAEVQGRGIQRLREAGIEVTVGVLEAECRWLNRRFFTFHEKNRPYIILKWAQTADGFLDADGKALAISTPFTKMLVHKLRAEEDAIVVGRVTWESDHPQLNVREWGGRSPVRFVVSRSEECGVRSEECGVRFVETIEELMAKCHELQLQSLIVEGGRQTLQAFLDRDLWDEIRLETGAMESGKGTRALQVPSQAVPVSASMYGKNAVASFRHP